MRKKGALAWGWPHLGHRCRKTLIMWILSWPLTGCVLSGTQMRTCYANLLTSNANLSSTTCKNRGCRMASCGCRCHYRCPFRCNVVAFPYCEHPVHAWAIAHLRLLTVCIVALPFDSQKSSSLKKWGNRATVPASEWRVPSSISQIPTTTKFELTHLDVFKENG